MKKELSTILLLGFVALAVTSNPAHASPPTADHPVILKEAVTQVMPTFQITKYEAIGEVSFVNQISTDNTPAALPASTVQVPEIVAEVALVPDFRIRMHRHYFIHEDNKQYNEYRPGNLSDGFIKPLDKPARQIIS